MNFYVFYLQINVFNIYGLQRWHHSVTGSQSLSTIESRDTHVTTENAGVEIAGVDRTGGKCRSKSYGTPNRDYFERILSYLNLVR